MPWPTIGEQGNVGQGELEAPFCLRVELRLVGVDQFCGKLCGMRLANYVQDSPLSRLFFLLFFSCRAHSVAGISQSEATWHFQRGYRHSDEDNVVEMLQFHAWIWISSREYYQNRNRLSDTFVFTLSNNKNLQCTALSITSCFFKGPFPSFFFFWQ